MELCCLRKRQGASDYANEINRAEDVLCLRAHHYWVLGRAKDLGHNRVGNHKAKLCCGWH